MAFAVFDFADNFARWARSQVSRSRVSGRDRSSRTARRCRLEALVDFALDRTAHRCRFTASMAIGAFCSSAIEEAAARVCPPAPGLGDRTGLSRGLVQPAKAGQGVGLHNAGIARKEALGVLLRSAAGGSGPSNGRSSRTTVHSRPSLVLPFASTGTGVSSAWMRAAARTCACDRRGQRLQRGGDGTHPSRGASRRRGPMPSRAKQTLCRFSGRCSPYGTVKLAESRLGRSWVGRNRPIRAPSAVRRLVPDRRWRRFAGGSAAARAGSRRRSGQTP